MKVRTVKRYSCDFCKKANCSAASISKHEKHCTLNPNRECGMCERVGNVAVPISDTIALLPDPSQFGELYIDLDKALAEAMPKLREVTDNCPACILACLRQRGVHFTSLKLFDYKEEVKKFWAEVNQMEYEADQRSCMYG